ncbi:MAG: tetratricopeptide repeat protein, partial [Fuerstiella sp.]|nr:tetratricopeptide repeat protein [Fuerstiella sp.]
MYVDDYETAHLGTALRQQGRLGESHDAFRSAMNVQASATALINLGTILVDLGQLDAAYDYLIAARDIAPHIPQIHINRAPIQRDRGDEAAALESLATAEELRPGSAELHTNRGNLLLHLGQPVEAVSSFQQAIAIDSSAP